VYGSKHLFVFASSLKLAHTHCRHTLVPITIILHYECTFRLFY